MRRSELSTSFEEHVYRLTHEDPQALILGWWCRFERALRYYYIAYIGQPPRSAFVAIKLVAMDVRIAPADVDDMHMLRIWRNRLAHTETRVYSAQDARGYATLANHLIWKVGNCVPDELAISSGAAHVA
jgi:hypothetical protein